LLQGDFYSFLPFGWQSQSGMIEKINSQRNVDWFSRYPLCQFLGEDTMDKKDLKKLLASLGVAGLISMGGITLPGAHAGSGWGANTSAGGTEKQVKTPAGSGGSDPKGSAVSAEQQKKMEQMKTEEQSAEEKAKKAAEEEAETVKKKAGKSGWSGNKWSCRMHDKKLSMTGNHQEPAASGCRLLTFYTAQTACD
jgi:radical SAM modification target selenobiotic family peptide